MSIQIGDWVRIDDGSYRVGQVLGSTYGSELSILLSYGQVVEASSKEVTVIPRQTGEPRTYQWPAAPKLPSSALPEAAPGFAVSTVELSLMRGGRWE
jgi:hypothetical protein